MAFVSADPSTSGTYALEGNNLLMSALGTDTRYSYCVSGGRMTAYLETLAKTGVVMGPMVLEAP